MEGVSAGRGSTYNALLQACALQHGHPDIGPAGKVHDRVLVLQVGQQEVVQGLQVAGLREVAAVRGVPAAAGPSALSPVL